MTFFKSLFIVTLLLFNRISIADTEITIGYQTDIEPSKIAIADGQYEKATDTKIHWRRFDNGAELIRAMASKDVDIGNIGSSILATAASHQLPIQAFLVAAQLGQSEALVARNDKGINQPSDLIGKTIAVPFVSTAHYSLLCAFETLGN
jgi:taurine transport system substrate-binding protein